MDTLLVAIYGHEEIINFAVKFNFYNVDGENTHTVAICTQQLQVCLRTTITFQPNGRCPMRLRNAAVIDVSHALYT